MQLAQQKSFSLFIRKFIDGTPELDLQQWTRGSAGGQWVALRVELKGMLATPPSQVINGKVPKDLVQPWSYRPIGVAKVPFRVQCQEPVLEEIHCVISITDHLDEKTKDAGSVVCYQSREFFGGWPHRHFHLRDVHHMSCTSE